MYTCAENIGGSLLFIGFSVEFINYFLLCFLLVIISNVFVCVVTDPCYSDGVLPGAQYGTDAATEPTRPDAPLLAQRGLTEQ